MDALDSLVDFAALVSISVCDVKDKVNWNNDNSIPLPKSNARSNDQTSPIAGTNQLVQSGMVPRYWPSNLQESAFVEIYQRPRFDGTGSSSEPSDVRPHVHEHTVFRQLQTQQPQWPHHMHGQNYPPNELCAHPELVMERDPSSDDRHLPLSVKPHPLDFSFAVEPMAQYPYPQLYHDPAAEHERQYGAAPSCADPRCVCRFYGAQIPYAIDERGAMHGRDMWGGHPARFGARPERVPRLRAGWEMDTEVHNAKWLSPNRWSMNPIHG